VALEKFSLQLSSLFPTKPDSTIHTNSSTMPDQYLYAWHAVVISATTNEQYPKNFNIKFITDKRNCQFL
jgi:hypothetical protein